MGNGHAPGTATGLGIAGAGVAVTGFGALRRWTAGLAVFFFAAFLTAGFLAGFFLPADFRAAVFRPAAFPTFFPVGFVLRTCALRKDRFFAVFFFTAFFAFAMITSGCVYDDSGYSRRCAGKFYSGQGY